MIKNPDLKRLSSVEHESSQFSKIQPVFTNIEFWDYSAKLILKNLDWHIPKIPKLLDSYRFGRIRPQISQPYVHVLQSRITRLACFTCLTFQFEFEVGPVRLVFHRDQLVVVGDGPVVVVANVDRRCRLVAEVRLLVLGVVLVDFFTNFWIDVGEEEPLFEEG